MPGRGRGRCSAWEKQLRHRETGCECEISTGRRGAACRGRTRGLGSCRRAAPRWGGPMPAAPDSTRPSSVSGALLPEREQGFGWHNTVRGNREGTLFSSPSSTWIPRASDLVAEACPHSPGTPSLSPLKSGPQLLWTLKRLNEPRSRGQSYCLWGGVKPPVATQPGPDVSGINRLPGLSNLWSVAGPG